MERFRQRNRWAVPGNNTAAARTPVQQTPATPATPAQTEDRMLLGTLEADGEEQDESNTNEYEEDTTSNEDPDSQEDALGHDDDDDDDDELDYEEVPYDDVDIDPEDDELDHGMAEAARGQLQPFDPATRGLKEISNLGKFTVSSHKLGNGIEELRADDLKLFWQSDGPQPHKLTIYFIKRVAIRDIRFYVDADEDESYTPTRIVFKSGTGENNLIEFATMMLVSPVGWQKVPIEGAGGGPDGNTLFSWVLQMQVCENHQNGKDTHLRAIRIYAQDQDSAAAAAAAAAAATSAAASVVQGSADDAAAAAAAGGDGDVSMADADEAIVGQKELDDLLAKLDSEMAGISWTTRDGGVGLPDFMREPELR